MNRWLVAFFSLALLKCACLMWAADDYLIAHTLSDDAFYYLGIAKRAWTEGIFPSFDGIHLTNGFHFLYQVLLIPLVPLLTDGLATTYRLTLALNEGFFLLGSFFLWRLLERYLPKGQALACIAFVLLGGFPFKIVNTGLESALAFFIGNLFLWATFCVRSAPWTRGLLLGLLLLSRLDMGCFYALFYGWWERRQVKETGLALGIAALAYLPVLILNLTLFGHVGTISQATKVYATFSQAPTLALYGKQLVKALIHYGKQVGGNTVGDLLTLPYVAVTGKAPAMEQSGQLFETLIQHWAVTLLLLLAIGGMALFINRRLPSSTKRDSGKSPLPAFLVALPLVHFATVALLLSYHGGIWYWLPLTVGLAVALAPQARPALLFFALTGLLYLPTLLFQSGAWQKGYRERSWYTGPIEIAEYAREHLPPDGVIGCYNAGLFGYLCSQRVTNLDGLVNNFELLEARKEGRVRDYLTHYQIGYLADFGPWDKYLPELGFTREEVELLFQSSTTSGYLLRLPTR